MATIKRNQSKLILKSGKVSCSCCDTECCMYPAQALADGLYSADDLPDTIVIKLENQLQPGPEYCPEEVLLKSNDDYLYGYGNPLDTTPGNSAARIGLTFVENGGYWVFTYNQVQYIEPQGNRAYLGSYESFCLLSSEGDGPNLIEDQFADTYTVTINPPDDNAGTYTVTRRSICVWSTQVQDSGEPAGLKLSYIDAVIGGGFAYTWEIELDTSYIKDGFANTPTGDYSGGNATVS